MEMSKKEIQVLEKQVSPLVKDANDYQITNVQNVDEASVILRKLRDTERAIENKRREFTQPLVQSLRAINATFKEIIEPLCTARGILTRKIVSWKTAERERLEKEEARRRKIQEAHEKKGHEVKAPVVLDRPDNKIGNTQTRKVWRFDIVDFSKIPDEFKNINEVAVNQVVRSGVREIKGIKIYQEEKLSIVGR